MKFLFLGLLILGAQAAGAFAEETISFGSLLDEMIDSEGLAKWPQPAYRQLQASSYNRASQVRGGPGWFADSDGVGFIRTEQRDGRTEWVLMEYDGPGCVTRI